MLGKVLNILFPPICPLCGGGLSEGGLCRACLGTIKEVHGPVCTLCGIPFATGAGADHLCGVCLESSQPFQKARSAVLYEGAALEAIHRLKYGGRLTLARPLGRIACGAVSRLPDGTDDRFKSPGHISSDGKIQRSPSSGTFDVVVPVPLHKGRLKERGFNQSLLIAREVATGLGAEVDYRSLRRIRPTRPQVDLKTDERRKNVRGAFGVIRPERVRRKRVVLVDDVFTTGATVRECAKVLKRAGAEVYVLTLARVVRF
jgi:ComF family protein